MMLSIVGGVGAHTIQARQAWYQLYILALDGGLIYLLGYATVALVALTRDDKQRSMALIYIVPCGAGVMAHAGQLVLSWVGADSWTTAVAACTLVWIAGFALAATISWNRKIRGFRSLQRALKTA
ncbi:hypothetical protein [Mycolicibacterium septicum]|uniref:hypothetical protein n=1 Tax=Mycolicibacterium septicum TaxID=98668 RepID=UPI001AF3E905|nr:hypothetical protein [Mycolicibacterium septicum]QRY51843.1 hypothetical protein JVX95_31465 [Mycolicibacterium septicum]